MKRFTTILGIFTLLLFSFAHAQQTWERAYGEGPNDNAGFSVQQTTDGGYIVSGATNWTPNIADVYLIKTNASGDTLWTRTYGGANQDLSYSVRQTSDGGYIVAGSVTDPSFHQLVYLIKTNATGDTLWSKTYGGRGYNWGRSVQQTSDTGYIVAGVAFLSGRDQDVYLIKTDVDGDTLWSRTYGGYGVETGWSVQQTQDGGYIVAGSTTSFGDSCQAYLIKTNATGDTLWTRTYGGPHDDWGRSVQQTEDGGYIIAGTACSIGPGDDDIYLIKTNASGDTLWTRTYGGMSYDWGESVRQTTDGGYIVAGETYSFGNGYYDVYLIKTNASGDTLWTRSYGGTNYDKGSSVQQTSDGGYIVAGWTASFENYAQVYLIKTDVNGNVGVETPVRQFDGSTVRQLKANPNPFTSFATLPGHEAERFSLYDISGRKVGTFRGDRVGERLRAGVYFIRTLEGKSGQVRIVKVR